MRLNVIKPQNSKLIPAKVRLIARLKSDGSIYRGGRKKTNYFLKYESNNEQELNRFENDIKEVYGLKPKIQLHRSGKNPSKMLKQVFVRSKLAFEDMQKYGPYYSENWKIPKEIKEGSNLNKIEFLRVFAEDEGTIILKRKEIRIYSINKAGLEELQSLFLDFDIKSRIQKGYGMERNVFGLIIKEKSSLINFGEYVGLMSEIKKSKLAKLLSLINS